MGVQPKKESRMEDKMKAELDRERKKEKERKTRISGRESLLNRDC